MNATTEHLPRTQQGIDYASFLLKCWGILVLLLFPYMVTDGFHSDSKVHLSKVVEDSDYTTTLYASGKLALAGKYRTIYPPLAADQLSGNPYDIAAHQFLPNMSRSRTASCPYFPLAVLLFAPLTVLSPSYAFFAWQCLSVVALAVSALLIDNLRSEGSKAHRSGNLKDHPGKSLDEKEEKNSEPSAKKEPTEHSQEPDRTRQLPTFWLALAFLPVVHCLFIGQTALILGLLPSTVGFFLLRRNRPLLAGLVWSLTFFKPQFFLACAFVCGGLIFRRNLKPLLALTLGALLLCAVSAATCGLESLKLWLNAMHVVDHVYSSAKNGVVMAIVASLPRMCILSSSEAAQPAVKVIAYLVSCAFAGISLLLAYRCSASDLNALEYKNVLLCLALCLVPLATPYLFFYDLSVMTLLWATADSAHRNLRSLFVSCALLTNLYAIVVVVPSLAKLATPWLLLLIYLEMYRRVLLINWRKKPGELTAPPTRATDAAY